MKLNLLPTVATLQRLYTYDPATGNLSWRTGRNKGQIAGCKTYRKDGSPHAIHVKLGDGIQYSAQAHRIIWKLVTGLNPGNTIDHADGNPFNNSWSNLREATSTQQGANKRGFNRTGFKGVGITPAGRFYASISVNKKTRYIGVYSTPQEAHDAYKATAIKIHKQFARMK